MWVAYYVGVVVGCLTVTFVVVDALLVCLLCRLVCFVFLHNCYVFGRWFWWVLGCLVVCFRLLVLDSLLVFSGVC